MIDGVEDTGGGRFRLRPQARELFEATVDGSGGAQKPRTGYGKDSAGRALWAVYGSVRGCIQGHSDLALVVQHMEWQRLGVTVREGAQDKKLQCTMDRESGF